MKINPRFLLAILAASSLSAAPLTKPMAVHVRPDAASPAIAVLGAGTEPALAQSPSVNPPAGWTAVELSGPHEVFVQNKDLTKGLDVRPGSSFYTAPKLNAPVLTKMEKGDKAEITGLQGRWTQIRLEKKVVGYIGDDSGGFTAPAPVAATGTTPVGPANVNALNATSSSPISATAPAASASPIVPAPGHAAPASVSAGNNGVALPRLFEGTFIPAKRFLAYKPYPYQLNDRAGKLYAFLDVSGLMKTEQFDRYVNRTVTIFGTAKPIPDTKDIVIVVESIQVR